MSSCVGWIDGLLTVALKMDLKILFFVEEMSSYERISPNWAIKTLGFFILCTAFIMSCTATIT